MEKSPLLNGSKEKSKDELSAALKTATTSVLLRSTPMPENAVTVKGPDFNNQLSLHELLEGYSRMGFQATSLDWRLSHEPILPDETEEYKEPLKRSTTKCKIFLGYTSNLVSSGLREIIRYLVQNSLVDVIVTTAGGVEEDFIKCLGQTYLADFQLNGAELRKNGMNRIGNLVVPNDNYCKFEDWVVPILDKLLEEQRNEGIIWSPSKIINRLGKEINNPDSIYYWAYKNNIPVYCPALTDGSLGDMIYFHTFKNPGLVIDIVSDIRSINQQAVFARKTGVIILGGGLVKHHICNANLMRNGADYAVYINTGQEFDGSDSGARPDEAVSWGKIKTDAEHIKVYADATIVFPLIVSETFVKEVHGSI
ncbi:6444_t:CDS:2 [Funneliformis geosporum]|uniref:deoxyhypusine synthase n=1 Tax=Funneliformis geosporum TaxID=1117311 RepID=A0A9W4SVG0_9GLOM|nr:6444_t:CDS:2 [Funneliformis geosporum]